MEDLLKRLTEALKEQPELLQDVTVVIVEGEKHAAAATDLQDQLAVLAKTVETLEAENKRLSAKAETADGKTVKGSFEATIVKDGVEKKVKCKFQPGALTVRLADGTTVPTEKVIELANGKALSGDDLKHEGLSTLVDAKGKDNGGAKKLLTHLAQIGYGLLVIE